MHGDMLNLIQRKIKFLVTSLRGEQIYKSLKKHILSLLISYVAQILCTQSTALSLYFRLWKASLPALFETVNCFLSNNEQSQFVLTYGSRALQTERYMMTVAEDAGFQVTPVPLQSFMNDQQAQIYSEVFLLIFTRKKIGVK